MNWVNISLISNSINRNFNDYDLLIGVLRSLSRTDKTIPIDEYMSQHKDSEINVAKIERTF